MQKTFAQAFKNSPPLKLEGLETQELTAAANAVRLILVKREITKLFDKETAACILATD
jgi:hypothetical protein